MTAKTTETNTAKIAKANEPETKTVADAKASDTTKGDKTVDAKESDAKAAEQAPVTDVLAPADKPEVTVKEGETVTAPLEPERTPIAEEEIPYGLSKTEYNKRLKMASERSSENYTAFPEAY